MPTPLQDALIQLYQQHRPLLTAYPWEWEEDRWGELVKCVAVAMGLTPDQATVLLEVLLRLQLSSVSALAHADENTVQFIAKIILQLSTESTMATNVASAITSVARGVREQWAGYVQRFLRRHNLAMIEELGNHLHDFGIERTAASRAAILWLQNVANAPVLMEDERVRDFCARFNVSREQLIEEADRVGVNLSVLEDLLVTEHQIKQEPPVVP
jgi:hypothetical protein